MPGTFGVTVGQSYAPATVTVRITSYNNYQGTVTMTYSTLPSTPSVVLSKTTQTAYVPKDGEYIDTVTVQFDDENTSCHFYASGTDGTISAMDDREISAQARSPVPEDDRDLEREEL